MKTVSFFGHRDSVINDNVRSWLYEAVEAEIHDGARLFYFGGYGSFDSAAAAVVWDLKRKYPDIKSVLVLAYLNRKHETQNYDDTIYPPLENVPMRYAISARNEWIIRESDVVIAYVLHSWGGASKALEYAIRRDKQIRKYVPKTI